MGEEVGKGEGKGGERQKEEGFSLIILFEPFSFTPSIGQMRLSQPGVTALPSGPRGPGKK